MVIQDEGSDNIYSLRESFNFGGLSPIQTTKSLLRGYCKDTRGVFFNRYIESGYSTTRFGKPIQKPISTSPAPSFPHPSDPLPARRTTLSNFEETLPYSPGHRRLETRAKKSLRLLRKFFTRIELNWIEFAARAEP